MAKSYLKFHMFEQISKNLTQKSYLFQKFLPICQLDQSQIGKIPTQKRFKKSTDFRVLQFTLLSILFHLRIPPLIRKAGIIRGGILINRGILINYPKTPQKISAPSAPILAKNNGFYMIFGLLRAPQAKIFRVLS